MQAASAAVFFAPSSKYSFFPRFTPTYSMKTVPQPAGRRRRRSSIFTPPPPPLLLLLSQTSQFPKIKAFAAAEAEDTSTVDYDSTTTSVFPAEACETIGGEACDVEMYPEVKLTPQDSNTNQARTGSEMVERDYLDYDSPKTVFPGEACDDLGGEFCDPEYQTGVY